MRNFQKIFRSRCIFPIQIQMWNYTKIHFKKGGYTILSPRSTESPFSHSPIKLFLWAGVSHGRRLPRPPDESMQHAFDNAQPRTHGGKGPTGAADLTEKKYFVILLTPKSTRKMGALFVAFSWFGVSSGVRGRVCVGNCAGGVVLRELLFLVAVHTCGKGAGRGRRGFVARIGLV